MFSRKPTLDPQDQKKIALSNLSQLESALGKIHVTATGLVLESRLLDKITTTINTATKPITIEDLAAEFAVSHSSVRACIAQTPFYLDQSTLYGPKVLEQVTALVPADPQLSVDFCTANGITLKLLQHLRGSVALVGDYVLKQSALDRQKQQLEKLFGASEPVEIPESPILDQIVSHMDYDGRFDRNTRTFTPTRYRNQQRDQTANQVRSAGAMPVSSLDFNPKKFAKRYDFVLHGDHILSHQYILDQTSEAKKQLETKGFFDTTDLQIPVPLDLKAQEIVPGVYFRQSFENSLKSQLAEEATKQGQQDAAQIASIDASSNSRKLANQLSPPTTTEINSQLATQLAALLTTQSPKVAKVLAQRLTVPIRDAYLDSAASAIDSRIQLAQQAVTARIAAYWEGVLTCKDQLRDALFEEWQTYAGENDPSTSYISSLDQAKEYFAELPHQISIPDTVVQMNEANIAKLEKLEKPKDGATILHLALVIYHSRIFENKAIIKCRGKQIPKILKQFEFPECFSTLKTNVTKKEDPSESIKAVKQVIKNA